jgi:propionate CoA-transferase
MRFFDAMSKIVRAVFELKDGKVVLAEIAPGIDIKKDIFSQMDFEPVISKQLKPMDEGIFCWHVLQ